nr:hypothetical protein [uncultured Dyadobacter sp.]
MEKDKFAPGTYPQDGKSLIFTDMLGVVRKGIYKSDKHGFQQREDMELPHETQFVFPEDDIVSWEYESPS